MKKAKKIMSLLLVSIMIVLTLGGCTEDDPEWHTCLKCNGSGKIRDKYGYYAYVSCTRCDGRGKLYY